MTYVDRIVNTTVKGLTRALCRVDESQLDKVPAQGPLILVANHVNFLEVPLVLTHLMPRPVTGFAKAETWDNPVMAWLFDLWGAIPLRRGEADMDAVRRGLDALREGKILAVAPEGTRSGTGVLGRGHAGIVILALRSGAPLLPLVFYGGEKLYANLRSLRRTDFRIHVGRPFRLEAGPQPATREVRQLMTDEIMYQLAALLPPAYRGYYADLSAASERHLRFLEGSPAWLAQNAVQKA